jgi:hypothetical protein
MIGLNGGTQIISYFKQLSHYNKFVIYISDVQLLETRKIHIQLSKWFLGFITIILTTIKDPILVCNHCSAKKNSNNQP